MAVVKNNNTFLLASIILLLNVLETKTQIVTSLSRTKCIIAGGQSMDVFGSGFSISSSPRAVITMYYQNAVHERFSGSVCTVSSSSAISCVLPAVSQFPAAYTPPDISAGEDPLINEPSAITFKIGVSFTNQITYREHQDLNVYADPDLTGNNINRIFSIWTNRNIYIKGHELLGGAAIVDYAVMFNDQECVVDFVNNTLMHCNIPLDIPTPNNDMYTVIDVSIGDLTERVGKIRYRVPEFEMSNPLAVKIYYPNDFSSRIEVSGTGLIVGLTADDYEVYVGQSPCTNIMVSTLTLSCRGPSFSPTPSGSFQQHADNYPQLIITVPKSANTVNFQYTYHPAYVRYLNHDYSGDSPVPVGGDSNQNEGDTNNDNEEESNGSSSSSSSISDTTKWVIISICIALVLLFTAVLISCLCCTRRYRYREEEKSDRRYLDSVAVLSAGTPSTSHRTRSNHSPHSYPSQSDLHRMYDSRSSRYLR